MKKQKLNVVQVSQGILRMLGLSKGLSELAISSSGNPGDDLSCLRLAFGNSQDDDPEVHEYDFSARSVIDTLAADVFGCTNPPETLCAESSFVVAVGGTQQRFSVVGDFVDPGRVILYATPARELRVVLSEVFAQMPKHVGDNSRDPYLNHTQVARALLRLLCLSGFEEVKVHAPSPKTLHLAFSSSPKSSKNVTYEYDGSKVLNYLRQDVFGLSLEGEDSSIGEVSCNVLDQGRCQRFNISCLWEGQTLSLSASRSHDVLTTLDERFDSFPEERHLANG